MARPTKTTKSRQPRQKGSKVTAARTKSAKEIHVKHLKESAIPSYWNSHLPRPDDVVRLRRLSAPHVESFNYFLEHGLANEIEHMEKFEIDMVDRKALRTEEGAEDEIGNNLQTLRMWFENVSVAAPTRQAGTGKQHVLRPRECRERGIMYAGELSADFCYQYFTRRNGPAVPLSQPIRIPKTFGNMPIMVQSSRCHLAGLNPRELAKLKEEETEFGGYFIVNGIERVMRMLQIPRRNYATAISRSSYKKRGNEYTDLGVAMRCVVPYGCTSITNTVHYMTTGSVILRFVARKQEFLIPVVMVLRALMGSTAAADSAAGSSTMTDQDIYQLLVQGDDTNTFLTARAALLLEGARASFPHLNTPTECLAHLGERFRTLSMVPESMTDVEIGHYMLRNYIMVHLGDYHDKLQCLLFMIRKLYVFAARDCGVDNSDSVQNHDVLLPGHLLTAFVKEKFDEILQRMKRQLSTHLFKDFTGACTKMQKTSFMGLQLDRAANKSSGGIGKKVSSFLSTGNVESSTGLDLMQTAGYTIVAERLNFLRFCAHFRSVHRGSFFMEMKTTAVRKLLPDQWGFLCPVHTPDGGPCGLLGHLALKCKVMAFPDDTEHADNLQSLLVSLGMIVGSRDYKNMPILLDGRVVGAAPSRDCKRIAAHLRQYKVEGKVPPTMEVALVNAAHANAPYPGLYLFIGAGRVVRPVLQRASGKQEMIGPLEQGFMDIACLEEDVREGTTTHQELDPMNMLSLIASLTPFSDQNQSPRNMYQCQMGKQTMGTPVHSLPYRADNKLYKLQTPQAPLVQTNVHREFMMDEYPNGTNAVVGTSLVCSASPSLCSPHNRYSCSELHWI